MGMTIQNFDLGGICLGNNEFETGVITLGSGDSCKAGQFLLRDTGKFEVLTDSDTEVPVAICMEDITNSGNASADFPTRVLIAGKVNAGKLLVNAAAPTAAELDLIRGVGISPIPFKELGMQDNQ